jgi:hypothetical protein
MVGITLSTEQIKSAPPEVRRWLEHEIATTLGFGTHEAGHAAPSAAVQLAELSESEASRVFALIQSDYVACQVFFELARETPNSRSGNGLRAFSIAEIARHVRLGDLARLANCFGTLNAAFQQVCGDGNATLFGFDELGCCYVSEVTHQTIRLFWQKLVAEPTSRGDVAVIPIMPGPARPATQPASSPPFGNGERPQTAG